MYRLDADGVLAEVLGGVTVSNGIGFSADGESMFYIDTLPRRALERYDVAADALSHRRRLAAFNRGNPDGLTLDVEGCVWVAVWGAAEVVRVSPFGTVLERIPLPALRPTAVALVESRLVVTTARVGLSRPGPADGAILQVEVDVPGVPAFHVLHGYRQS